MQGLRSRFRLDLLTTIAAFHLLSDKAAKFTLGECELVIPGLPLQGVVSEVLGWRRPQALFAR